MVGIEYNVCIKDVEPLIKGHWNVWSRDVCFCFLEAGLIHFLDGTHAPTEADPRKKHDKWAAINSRIIGTLRRIVSPGLKQQLTEDMTAADAWLLLKKRTQQDGIFVKLNSM